MDVDLRMLALDVEGWMAKDERCWSSFDHPSGVMGFLSLCLANAIMWR